MLLRSTTEPCQFLWLKARWYVPSFHHVTLKKKKSVTLIFVPDAAIISNAGGRVNDETLRHIESLDHLTAAKGGVTTIVVAHHTGK